MDPELARLKEFEDEAWRQVNATELPLPAQYEERLTRAWSRLSGENRGRIASAADSFLAQMLLCQKAEDDAATATQFKGSNNDDDNYGEGAWRLDFEEYAERKRNLLTTLYDLLDCTRTLQQERRLLSLPTGDYGDVALQDLISHYDQEIPRSEAEMDDLPKQRQGARFKLAERKRIAEGRLGPLWEGKWPLGAGTFGKATLFVKQDPFGRVFDHVVIKDTSYTNRPDLWNLKELWTGWKGPEDLSSIPNEVQAMYNLRDKAGSESIVRIRNWRIRRADMFHRIYLDFCPQGDLFDFVCGRYYRGAVRRKNFPNADVRNRVELVPEPFLWSVFWSLATAGLLMERGKLESGVNGDDWDVIVHRDLKLSNVFVGWNSTDRFKGYPSVKVADFGLALLIPNDNDKVSEDYGKYGTPGNRAPEQVRYLPAGDGSTKMMTSKTNVWNAGIVMWSLIACDEGLNAPFVDWNDDTNREIPQFDLTARLHYSEELLSLIHRCLRFNDEERPSFDEVMGQIKELTGDGPFDMASGLRDAAPDDSRWQNNQITFDSPSIWKKNMRLRDIPRPGGGTFATPPAPGTSMLGDDIGGAPGTEIMPEVVPTIPATTGSSGAGSAGGGAMFSG